MKRTALLIPFLLFPASILFAASDSGKNEEKKDLLRKSRPLRTVLHRDPAMKAPFERLYKMYVGAGHCDTLLNIYREHLKKYPSDQNARIVLIRILLKNKPRDALTEAQNAVKIDPHKSYFHFLHHRALQESDQEAKALGPLQKAIENARLPARRRRWIERLLQAAYELDKSELCKQYLAKLARLGKGQPSLLLQAAQRMQELAFYTMTLKTLEEAREARPGPEDSVNIELLAAETHRLLGDREKAAQKLDQLLVRLTPDYWRRFEIWQKRLGLIQDETERHQLLQKLRKCVKQNPHDGTAVLDLSQLLAMSKRRREAVEVLLKGSRQIPRSLKIEKELLNLFDLIRDERGREKYLRRRLKRFPERRDLHFAWIKTLFLLGQCNKASDELDTLLAQLSPAEQARQLLKLGRFLRRSALPTDAVHILERLLKVNPNNMSVRRELAEIYLTLGERQSARRILTKNLPENPTTEELLDIVRFMISKKLYIEARSVVRSKLDEESTNLDLRMLLLTIEKNIGYYYAGRQLVRESRKLADTIPRYRQWLEAACGFHEHMASLNDFLNDERRRIMSAHNLRRELRGTELNSLSKKQLEKIAVYAEIAGRYHMSAEAVSIIENALAFKPDRNLRVKLRRQLISILDNQTGETKTLEKHLKELAAEDPDSRHRCWLRLALLHAQENNSSSARRKIGNIDFSAIQNAALLSRAYGKLHNMLDEKQRLSLSRQLVELEPGSLSHWEKRLMVLAVSAREEKLRSTLEQLRIGNDKISLPEKTKNILKAHQLASCWRSIAYRLAERRAKDLHQALRLTKDAAELISNSEQNLWVRWTQAYILRVMGRKKAARNATEHFRKATQKVKDKHDSPSVMIRFPDGLTLGRKHARKLLGNSEKNDTKQTKPSTTHIDKPLRLKWAFESNSDSPITAIEPLSKNRILLCDSYGELTCLNSQTGKLIWQKTDLLSPAETFVKAASTVAKTNPSTVALRSGPSARRIWRASSHSRDRALKLGPAKPVADDRGRIYFPRAGVFDCYEQSNGRFLWSAQVSPGHIPTHAGKKQWPRVCLCPYGGKILAFDPATGVVAAFAASTGKLIWQRLPNEMTNAALTRHSGASLRNGKLLVYGLTTALFDADTGELLWTFEPDRVRSFPIELSSGQPSLDDVKQATGYRIYPSRGSFPSGPPVAIRRSSSQHSVYLNHMARPRNWNFRSGHRSCPVSPGAAWHGQLRRSSGHSLILGDNNVLLFNSQGYSWHLPLEFPLVGETVRIHGACAGIAQNRAIVTYYGRIYAISLESGTTTQRYELSKIMQKGNSRPWIQIVPHGKYAYVTGPAGIMSVEVKTGETQFHQKWPKILQNRGENPKKQESGGSYPRVSSYSGASVYVKLSKNGPSEWISFTGLIQNQTLYTTYPPWRVVAMESSSE